MSFLGFASKLIVGTGLMTLAISLQAASALPDLIQRTKPSIVAVGTYERMRSPSFAFRGTGFAVGNGNLIATNAHVLPESPDPAGNETVVIRIPTNGGEPQQRNAKVVAADRSHDLALLRIDGPPLPALSLQASDVREGQELVFMGFPIGAVLGMSPVTHRAMISAITPIAIPGATSQQLNEKVIRRLRSGTFDIYQLDGTAYPGNSGGPLLEVESGKVVGIVNMVFVKGTKEAALTNPSGISFAVPALYLQDLLKQ